MPTRSVPGIRRAALAVSVVAATAAVIPSALDPASALSPARSAIAGPGCPGGRSAAAYRLGGQRVPTTSGAPRTCLVATGFGGSETQIAVTADGTLVYEPAVLTPGLAGTGYADGLPGPQPSTQLSPGGLAISRDTGGSWGFAAPGGATWVPQDDAIYVDRSTGRLFFYALSPDPVPASGTVPLQDQAPVGQAHLLASADDGRTWTETALTGFVESENPRFTSAPAPAGATMPSGYPDVVYWCGNNVVKAGLPVPSYRACYRSLDGGLSWQFASILSSYPLPQQSACGTNGETLQDNDPNYPEGAPDGTLYAEVDCGSSTFLARSTDEAATWSLVTRGGPVGAPVTLPADGELRVSSNGVLFLAYQATPTSLELSMSSDHGRTWSPGRRITPPGLGTIAQWAFAERGAGQIAASYLVQRGTSSDYDGWLTWSPNTTAADPVLWSAPLNATSSPMRTTAPPPARDDYIGVDIAPNGTPWASFAASCPGPVPGGEACAGQSSDPEANEAVAGRFSI